MDELDTGALAVDAAGVVRAANRLAREYLGLGADARGRTLEQALPAAVRERVLRRARARRRGRRLQEIDLPAGRGCACACMRRALAKPGGGPLGRVILAREISHEPRAAEASTRSWTGSCGADGGLRERSPPRSASSASSRASRRDRA